MTTTANSLPGTMTNVIYAGVPWFNINNMKLADGAVSTSDQMDDGTVTDYAAATNFGFSVPAGATITGVTIEVNCYTDRMFDGDPATIGLIAQLYNGALIGAQKSNQSGVAGGSLASSTLGSGSDKWSATLTPAIVNASTFGVAVQTLATGIGDTAPYFSYVDYIKMQIAYSTGPTAGQKMSMLMGGK